MFRAKALFQLNKFDETISDCTKVIALDASNTEAYLWRSRAYYATSKNDLAIGDLSSLLRIDPTNFVALKVRGQLLSQAEKYNSAIADFLAAAKLHPEDAEIYANLAVAYFKLKDMQHAQASAKRALSIKPSLETTYPILKLLTLMGPN